MEIPKDHVDWRILGHLLSGKHCIKTRGHGTISVTVIGMDRSDCFALIGSTNSLSTRDEIFRQVLYLVVPYSVRSTQEPALNII